MRTLEIKDGKYRVWSTVTDEYVTDWIDENELQNEIFIYKLDIAISEIIQEMICYPNSFINKDSGEKMICDESKYDESWNIIKNREKRNELFLAKMQETGYFKKTPIINDNPESILRKLKKNIIKCF